MKSNTNMRSYLYTHSHRRLQLIRLHFWMRNILLVSSVHTKRLLVDCPAGVVNSRFKTGLDNLTNVNWAIWLFFDWRPQYRSNYCWLCDYACSFKPMWLVGVMLWLCGLKCWPCNFASSQKVVKFNLKSKSDSGYVTLGTVRLTKLSWLHFSAHRLK